ncbi:MAG: carbonic anhydrase [Brasilonema sp.]
MNEKNQALNLSRRSLIKYGGGFLGTGLAATILGSNLASPKLVLAQNKDITPDEALKKLMDGNQRFAEAKRQNPHQTRERLVEVAKGQTPFAAILSCADSRVPSEIIFDQGLGDLFVVRVAGNVVTLEETGSLEFGTLILGAKALMVIGHKSCGAVIAAMKGGKVPGSIGSVLEQIQPAAEKFKGQQDDGEAVRKATEANVLLQVERLKKSPVITELIQSNKLKIAGAYYDLDTGKISLLS